jgi:hypothetical protein
MATSVLLVAVSNGKRIMGAAASATPPLLLLELLPELLPLPELLLEPLPLPEELPPDELLLPPPSAGGGLSVDPDEHAAADSEASPSAKIHPACIRRFVDNTLSSLDSE